MAPGGQLFSYGVDTGMQSSALLRIALLFLTATSLGAQGTRGIQSGTRPARIVIRNALVVIGNGTPASVLTTS